MIPKQLQKDGILFIKILKNSKRPFEKDWVNNGYTYEQINGYDGNYGVLGGKGNLIIIDSDTQELQEAVDKNLPKTFRVKTGGGGCHDYYICNDLDKKLVLTKDGKHYGEVQSYGSQVVGPGSTHPNGNKYEVEQEMEIQTLELAKLIEVIKPFTNEFSKKIEWKKYESTFDSEYDINSVSFKKVLSPEFFRSLHNGEYLGPNPWHGSTTGINFSINMEKNIAKCWRCDCGVNIAQAIAMSNGIIKTCKDKLSTPQFKEVVKIAQEKYGLKKPELSDNADFKEMKLMATQLLLAKKRDSLTENLVKYILQNKYIYTTRNDEKNEMWIYDNGIYIPEGKSHIGEFCRKILGESFTSHILNAVILKIEKDTAINEDEFFQSATENVEEIPVENGIFHLIDKTLTDFDPKKIFFNKIPVEYNPNAKCPNIEQHLKDVLATEDDINVMYEVFGYILWKGHFIEKGIMMVGDGRNGKGKTIDLMKRFIGIDNCCSVPLSNMTGDTFRLAELFGKMANLAGDLSNTALKDTGMFKQITGRDLISAKRKFKSAVTFINYSKQIFACNELPRVYDFSRGFWSRWILFEFPYTFLDNEEYELSKLSSKKLMNPEQIEKISTPEELSGLFNKAIEKLEKIRKKKNFSGSFGTDEVKRFWQRKSDSFLAFCMDNIDEDFDCSISVKQLRKIYQMYCKKHRVKGASKQSMTITLEQEFGAIQTKKMEEYNSEYIWEGIKIRQNSEYFGKFS